MKKILLLATLVVYLNSQYLGGLVAIVENEPITDYEISETMKNMNLNSTQALNILIREKLEDAQIKTLNINVTEYEVDQKISAIAEQNNLSLGAFENILASKGVSFSDFKADMKRNLQKEKLYTSIINSPNNNINRDNAIRFYEANKQQFSQFETISVSKYTSRNKLILERVMSNPMGNHKDVSIENVELNANEIEPRLASVFINTQVGSWTPIFTALNGEYSTFYVVEKKGSTIPSFETIEQEIIKAMVKQEQEVMVADYFNKLRIKANIQVIKR